MNAGLIHRTKEFQRIKALMLEKARAEAEAKAKEADQTTAPSESSTSTAGDAVTEQGTQP